MCRQGVHLLAGGAPPPRRLAPTVRRSRNTTSAAHFVAHHDQGRSPASLAGFPVPPTNTTLAASGTEAAIEDLQDGGVAVEVGLRLEGEGVQSRRSGQPLAGRAVARPSPRAMPRLSRNSLRLRGALSSRPSISCEFAGLVGRWACSGAPFVAHSWARRRAPGLEKYGWAVDYETAGSVGQRSLSECGAGCSVVLTFARCPAYATSQNAGSGAPSRRLRPGRG